MYKVIVDQKLNEVDLTTTKVSNIFIVLLNQLPHCLFNATIKLIKHLRLTLSDEVTFE